MTRNTKNHEQPEHTAQCVPLRKDPDMSKLKEMVANLPAERQAALAAYLDEKGESDDEHEEETT